MIGNEIALPGTVLEPGASGFDVAAKFAPVFMQQEKQKVAAQKEKEAKAKEIMGREIDVVAPWDVNEYSALVNEAKAADAAALKAAAANPLDPNLDITNPTSLAYMQSRDRWDALKQYVNDSKNNFKTYSTYIDKYDQTKDSPDDLEEIKRFTHASPFKHYAGEVEQPRLTGVFDRQAYLGDLAKNLGLSTEEAYAYVDNKTGLRYEGTRDVLSEERITEAAMNAALDPNDRYTISIDRQITKMPKEEQEALTKLAQAEKLTPQQYLAREEAKVLAREERKRAVEGSMAEAFGSGYKTEEMAAKRPVDITSGLKQGDLALFNAQSIPSVKVSSYGIVPPIGKSVQYFSSGALQDYVMDKEKIMIGDNTPVEIEYRAEVIEVDDNGDYTFHMKPDLSKLDFDKRTKVDASPRTQKVKKDQVQNFLWRKFPQFNANVKEDAMTRYLESTGGTYSETGDVRFGWEKDQKGGNPFDAPVGGNKTQQATGTVKKKF